MNVNLSQLSIRTIMRRSLDPLILRVFRSAKAVSASPEHALAQGLRPRAAGGSRRALMSRARRSVSAADGALQRTGPVGCARDTMLLFRYDFPDQWRRP